MSDVELATYENLLRELREVLAGRPDGHRDARLTGISLPVAHLKLFIANV
jgi:hypothetical protein